MFRNTPNWTKQSSRHPRAGRKNYRVEGMGGVFNLPQGVERLPGNCSCETPRKNILYILYPHFIKDHQRNNLNCPCPLAALLYSEEASVAHLRGRRRNAAFWASWHFLGITRIPCLAHISATQTSKRKHSLGVTGYPGVQGNGLPGRSAYRRRQELAGDKARMLLAQSIPAPP